MNLTINTSVDDVITLNRTTATIENAHVSITTTSPFYLIKYSTPFSQDMVNFLDAWGFTYEISEDVINIRTPQQDLIWIMQWFTDWKKHGRTSPFQRSQTEIFKP